MATNQFLQSGDSIRILHELVDYNAEGSPAPVDISEAVNVVRVTSPAGVSTDYPATLLTTGTDGQAYADVLAGEIAGGGGWKTQLISTWSPTRIRRGKVHGFPVYDNLKDPV